MCIKVETFFFCGLQIGALILGSIGTLWNLFLVMLFSWFQVEVRRLINGEASYFEEVDFEHKHTAEISFILIIVFSSMGCLSCILLLLGSLLKNQLLVFQWLVVQLLFVVMLEVVVLYTVITETTLSGGTVALSMAINMLGLVFFGYSWMAVYFFEKQIGTRNNP